MQMLEITALENGAHRNQRYNGNIPEGWAVIPDEMQLENFPFGDVTTEEVDGIQTVTRWTPGVIPVPDPDVAEPTLDERVTDLEQKHIETEQSITDLDLATIEAQQSITDLELMMLEGEV